MDKLPVINLVLIIVLFSSLLGLLLYFNYVTNQKFELVAQTLNTARTEINDAITDIDAKIDVQSKILADEAQNIRGEITDYKETSASELAQVRSSFEKLELKQEEDIEQLSSKISRVGVGDDFSGLVDDVIESVVGIATDKSVGSGVIVDGDGYVVTNHHVVNGISAAGVRTYDGELHRMYIVGSDQRRDIAVVKIEGSFPALRFGNSDRISVGEKIIALGSPGGLDFTVTQGIISAIRDRDGFKHIQTDVSVNPGNSGGPMVDSSGRIMGITKEKLADFEGIGFAIVSNEIDDYVQNLIDADKRARS